MREKGPLYRLGSALLGGAGLFVQLANPAGAQFSEVDWQNGPAELEIAGKLVQVPHYAEFRPSPVVCWSASESRYAGCDLSAYELRVLGSRLAVHSADGRILWKVIEEGGRIQDFNFLT